MPELENNLDGAFEELRALIGKEGPVVRGQVSRRDIGRFATAASDRDPIFLDEEAAAANGWAGIPAPELMLTSVFDWGAGPALGELRSDGTGVGREAWLPLEGLQLMGGGQELELHRPVFAGDEFTSRTTLTDVLSKKGGTLLLIVITIVYTDGDGEPLVTCRETLIAT